MLIGKQIPRGGESPQNEPQVFQMLYYLCPYRFEDMHIPKCDQTTYNVHYMYNIHVYHGSEVCMHYTCINLPMRKF